MAQEDGFAYAKVSSWDDWEYNAWYELSITEELPAGITGTVVADDTDVPIEDAYVELIEQYDGSWWEWTDSTSTDSSGSYGFSSLSAKRSPYRLYFNDGDGDYLPEYYDDARSWRDATGVTLKPGEQFAANAGLAPAARVAGVVTADNGDGPL